MKKKVYGRKLSRERDTRRALFRSLVKALVTHGEITTTKAKAKAIQADVDRLVNLAKEGTIAANRRIFAVLGGDKKIAKELLGKIVPSFPERRGGYTRIILLPRRRGDAAEVVRFGWVKKVVQVQDKVQEKKKIKGEKAKKKSIKGKILARSKKKEVAKK